MTNMTTTPATGSRTVRDVVREGFARSGMDVAGFAAAVGAGSTLVWQMVLDGGTKMPLTYIAPLCAVTGQDPAHVLRTLLAEYLPALLTLMDGLGDMPVLTANERRMIASLRNVTAGTDAEVVVADGRDLIAVVMV